MRSEKHLSSDERKLLPVLCAVVVSQDAWSLFRDRIVNELKKNINTPTLLASYENMMERNKRNISLLVEQFNAFEEFVFEVRSIHIAYVTYDIEYTANSLNRVFPASVPFFTGSGFERLLSIPQSAINRTTVTITIS